MVDLEIENCENDERELDGLIKREETLKHEFEQEIETETKGAGIRSKCDHYEYGEKSSKFFFGFFLRLWPLYNHVSNIYLL